MTRLKPSGADVWANCPGSLALPKFRPSTERRVEGILCHKLTRLLGTGQLNMDASLDEIQHTERFSAQDASALIEEHLEMARAAVEFCLGRGNVAARWEMELPSALSFADTSGIADFVTYDRTTGAVHIVENKFGYAPVSAIENWQLLCYAAGLLSTDFPGFPFKISEFHLHICQPRDYANGPFKTWVINVENGAGGLLQRLHDAAAAATNNPGQLHSGPHCRYCSSRTYCTAFQSALLTAFDSVITDPDGLPTDILAKEYAFLLDLKKLVVSALNAAESRMMHELEGGAPIPGWMLGTGRGRSKIELSVGRAKSLENLFGVRLTEERLLPLSKISKSARAVLSEHIVTAPGAKCLQPYNEAAAEKLFGVAATKKV